MLTHVNGPINSKAVIAYCHREKSFSKALEMAKKLYKGQKRDHTGFEYLSHPLIVSSLLIEVNAPLTSMLVAALQDTLARTTLKEASLRSEFGDDVADKVVALTAPRLETGAVFVPGYIEQLARAGADVQTIKLASLLDDLAPLSEKHAKKAQGLIDLAVELLPALESGNKELFRRVEAALRRAQLCATA